jgi:hypothetical protein
MSSAESRLNKICRQLETEKGDYQGDVREGHRTYVDELARRFAEDQPDNVAEHQLFLVIRTGERLSITSMRNYDLSTDLKVDADATYEVILDKFPDVDPIHGLGDLFKHEINSRIQYTADRLIKKLPGTFPNSEAKLDYFTFITLVNIILNMPKRSLVFATNYEGTVTVNGFWIIIDSNGGRGRRRPRRKPRKGKTLVLA